MSDPFQNVDDAGIDFAEATFFPSRATHHPTLRIALKFKLSEVELPGKSAEKWESVASQ